MLNLNIINVYTIITVFVYKAYSLNVSNEDSLNVGTVLFTPSDLNKKRWDRRNIEILQVRKYFQNIIPSPSSIDTSNEDYVDILLKYFTDAFSMVKREVTDLELATSMELALSDAIAGFFKTYLLPTTKFSYYGGAMSEENAIKAFNYYENLKNNLNTNGSGWKRPSKEVLNSLRINVIPFSHSPYTRSLKDPCEPLAYYEKYNDGLIIATPYINWKETPVTMFLPLKNESLVVLNSPSSSKALLKYYDVAEKCCKTKKLVGCSDFDVRFQDWVSNDVMPHLNDEKLYVAFGGVLTLLNNTKDYIYDCDDVNEQKTLLTVFPSFITSQKLNVLIFILLLEIIWCLPACLYLICCRKKRKAQKQYFDLYSRRNGSHYYYQTVKKKNSESDERSNDINKNIPQSSVNTSQSRPKENTLKLSQKYNSKKAEIDTQCPSHTSKHSIGQTTELFPDYITDSVCYLNEIPIKSLRDRTVSSKYLETKNNLSNHKNLNKDNKNSSQTESFVTVQKINSTTNKTLRTKSSSNGEIFNNINNICMKDRQKFQELHKCIKANDNGTCPCYIKNSFEASSTTKNSAIIESKPKTRRVDVKLNLPGSNKAKTTKKTDMKTTYIQKLERPDSVQRPGNINKRKDLKVSSDQVTELSPESNNTGESEGFVKVLPTKTSSRYRTVNSSYPETSKSLLDDKNIYKDVNSSSPEDSFSNVQEVNTTIITTSSSNNETSNNNDINRICLKSQEICNSFVSGETCHCSCCMNVVNFEASSQHNDVEIIEFKPRATRTNVKLNSVDSKAVKQPESSDFKKTKLPKREVKDFVQKDAKLNKKKGLKFNTGQPLLEIRIDKPATEITVDVTKYDGNSKKDVKPSKIPRRAPYRNIIEKNNEINHIKANQIDEIKPSTVTQVLRCTQKRSVDDLDIKKKKMVKRKAMNVTL